jgi:hypothetical protein
MPSASTSERRIKHRGSDKGYAFVRVGTGRSNSCLLAKVANDGDDSRVDGQFAGLLDRHHRVSPIVIGDQLDAIAPHPAERVGLLQRQPNRIDHVIAYVAIAPLERSDKADLDSGLNRGWDLTGSQQ